MLTPEVYQEKVGKSEVVKYHNEGIVINDSLHDMPRGVQKEIGNAQGWACYRN